ncbi:metal-dependent hydrolase [Candidatus Micrarchaeota archaeon]|nr:metal-dependent hydrolase [Candidatus Micrarchaeota archaeon]
MNWLQHLLVSLALCHAVLFVFHVPWSAPLMAAAALGAWFPDVDHEKTRIFKFSLAVVFALAFSFAYVALSPSIPAGNVVPQGNSFFPFASGNGSFSVSGGWALWASMVFALGLSLCWYFLKPRHRGIMHHPLMGVVLGAVLVLVSGNAWAGIVSAVAFGSHLGADVVWDFFN